MPNTAIKCLSLIAERGRYNASGLAHALFRGSIQFEKKERTIDRHLKILVRHGFILNLGGVYEATDAGREAAKLASQNQRPIMLGLA